MSPVARCATALCASMACYAERCRGASGSKANNCANKRLGADGGMGTMIQSYRLHEDDCLPTGPATRKATMTCYPQQAGGDRRYPQRLL